MEKEEVWLVMIGDTPVGVFTQVNAACSLALRLGDRAKVWRVTGLEWELGKQLDHRDNER